MSSSPQNQEAERVEESLRDFIGRIITYYEKYRLPGELLDRFEKQITEAETLLEVFEVMKEMFEELMGNINENGSREMLDCSELDDEDGKENFERALQKYEAEIKTHVKVEQKLHSMIQELQLRVEDTQRAMADSNEHIKKMESDQSSLIKRIEELDMENKRLKISLFEATRKRVASNGQASRMKEKGSKKKRKRSSIKHPLHNSKNMSIHKFLKNDPRGVVTSNSISSTKHSNQQNSYFIKPNLKNVKKKKKRGTHQNSSITNSHENKYTMLKNIFTTDTNFTQYERKVNPRRHKNASIV